LLATWQTPARRNDIWIRSLPLERIGLTTPKEFPLPFVVHCYFFWHCFPNCPALEVLPGA
jgi:hypothetical protein